MKTNTKAGLIQLSLITLATLCLGSLTADTVLASDQKFSKQIAVSLKTLQAAGFSEEGNLDFEAQCNSLADRFESKTKLVASQLGLSAPSDLELDDGLKFSRDSSSHFRAVRIGGAKHHSYSPQFEYTCTTTVTVTHPKFEFMSAAGESHFFESTCQEELARNEKATGLIYQTVNHKNYECTVESITLVRVSE